MKAGEVFLALFLYTNAFMVFYTFVKDSAYAPGLLGLGFPAACTLLHAYMTRNDRGRPGTVSAKSERNVE